MVRVPRGERARRSRAPTYLGEAAFSGLGEGDKGINDPIPTFRFRFFDGLRCIQSVAVEKFVHVFRCTDFLGRKSGARDANGVNHFGFGGITIRNHVRGDVLHALRTSGKHGVIADTTELMDASIPCDVNVIANMDVARDRRVAGDNDVVADYAIVGDVRVCEENVVIAENRPFAFLSAGVDADVFAESIAGTDAQSGFTRAGFEILSATADKCVGEDFAIRPEFGEPFDGGVVVDGATLAEGNIGTNERIGTDGDAFG